MSKFTRAEIVELLDQYQARIAKEPATAKFPQALELIQAELQQCPGIPSLKLRGYGSILKDALAEFTGKPEIGQIHGRFTITVVQFHLGADLQRATKRARVIYDREKSSLKSWITQQLEEAATATA